MLYISNGQLKHIDDAVLMHYGVKGMKWGVKKKLYDTYNKIRRFRGIKTEGSASNTYRNRPAKAAQNKSQMTPEQIKKQKAVRAVKIGAVVAGTVLAAYGAKKLNDVLSEFNARGHQQMLDRIRRQHDLSYQRYWLSQNTR